MRSGVRDELRAWLGEDVRALDVLSDQRLEELHGALAAARRRQAAALAAASDEVLRQLPASLRGRVGNMLGR